MNKAEQACTESLLLIHEYAFDITLAAAMRVKAVNEEQARKLLYDMLDAADANLGAWPDGSPILAEVSLDGRPNLFEIDGETHQEVSAVKNFTVPEIDVQSPADPAISAPRYHRCELKFPHYERDRYEFEVLDRTGKMPIGTFKSKDLADLVVDALNRQASQS